MALAQVLRDGVVCRLAARNLVTARPSAWCPARGAGSHRPSDLDTAAGLGAGLPSLAEARAEPALVGSSPAGGACLQSGAALAARRVSVGLVLAGLQRWGCERCARLSSER